MGRGRETIVGRDYRSSRWIELSIDGAAIADVRQAGGPEMPSPRDTWVAPAFWDIQVNGRLGHSFSSPQLTEEQVRDVVTAQASMGTARVCPTLITATREETLHGLKTIDAACRRWADVDRMVLGIHLEGPYLSEREGYRGAHPAPAMRDPDPTDFEELHEASGHRIVLVTLAPERRGAIEFIAWARSRGVAIALGHTAADEATLDAAVAAGASLSTHLGNGIAANLPRHPNPIWHQAADDRLLASLIADGHHLDADTLRVLARAKGPSRTILVSDASPLAGLPPCTYGGWAVDPAGKVVVAGTPYLAGSNRSLMVGLENYVAAMPCGVADAIGCVTANPARLLERPAPELEAGSPANLILFEQPEPGRLLPLRICVDGRWSEPSVDGSPRPRQPFGV
ncbi:N-acetylglucosamine-6-phosphate deacetylase [Aquisphaera giovannonii]|uniref:N-acetylglucosamine-6-phosphate deacetylase n=1 Tax=Aquisphaera giovannonii TaxID=406548 RepID=A0A5B9VY61_9BACT|nr:amidohydrolase family protein [Aquisphaera giovannonii]QEH33316.1 N-acetylglucosamine-6-phosphate deacetylase [Aquisphaera giovannonii]